MEKLILLHPADNVFIVRKTIQANEKISVNGIPIIYVKEIALGHKIASRDINKGEEIIKYGVPIGSATEKIVAGAHIHLHNMKSDYIQTYTLEKEFGHEQ
ncbi:MAG: UxaA family hydrolase [Bacteroidetes bacterium]|nr:UxaA family hydrolase [Bacteroidota bacterium]